MSRIRRSNLRTVAMSLPLVVLVAAFLASPLVSRPVQALRLGLQGHASRFVDRSAQDKTRSNGEHHTNNEQDNHAINDLKKMQNQSISVTSGSLDSLDITDVMDTMSKLSFDANSSLGLPDSTAATNMIQNADPLNVIRKFFRSKFGAKPEEHSRDGVKPEEHSKEEHSPNDNQSLETFLTGSEQGLQGEMHTNGENLHFLGDNLAKMHAMEAHAALEIGKAFVAGGSEAVEIPKHDPTAQALGGTAVAMAALVAANQVGVFGALRRCWVASRLAAEVWMQKSEEDPEKEYVPRERPSVRFCLLDGCRDSRWEDDVENKKTTGFMAPVGNGFSNPNSNRNDLAICYEDLLEDLPSSYQNSLESYACDHKHTKPRIQAVYWCDETQAPIIVTGARAQAKPASKREVIMEELEHQVDERPSGNSSNANICSTPTPATPDKIDPKENENSGSLGNAKFANDRTRTSNGGSESSKGVKIGSSKDEASKQNRVRVGPGADNDESHDDYFAFEATGTLNSDMKDTVELNQNEDNDFRRMK